MMTEATGARHAIATVNGTAALHAVLYAAGIKPGDEVLVPAFTFVATANAVSYCGATPHFVDCERNAFGIDPAALKTYLDRILIRRNDQWVNRNTDAPVRATVPVHCCGLPANMNALLAVAKEYGLVVIEDAAESLGTQIDDHHTGRFGRAGVFSFNGNKTITTGGGGAIVTDDDLFARRLRHLSTTARAGDGSRLDHDAVGFNYRMPNLNAALGYAQLETLGKKLTRKNDLAMRYVAALSGLGDVQVVESPPWGNSNYWLNGILFDAPDTRNAAHELLNENGYECRPFRTPLHHMPMYADMARSALSVSEDLAQHGLLLPSGSGLPMTKQTLSTKR
jgi:perosamine synthetase